MVDDGIDDLSINIAEGVQYHSAERRPDLNLHVWHVPTGEDRRDCRIERSPYPLRRVDQGSIQVEDYQQNLPLPFRNQHVGAKFFSLEKREHILKRGRHNSTIW